ncbi:hypothetical protein N9Z65_01005 [bacterium]|nr:hypothetical protein [bacterium]
MAKTNDLKDLGEVYGNLGSEATVVAESLEAQTVGDKDISTGNADLTDEGGPTEKGGFEESEIDIKKVGDKNPYNVKGLSYGDDNCPTLETDEPKEQTEGDSEEDPESSTEEEDEEEISKEALEIAQEGLNKYMANKSIFDKLYAKVINEDFGMEEVDDLDALGIEDATPDDEVEDADADDAEGEITVTLDKEMAKSLCDLLQAAIGEEPEDADADADELEVDAPEAEDYEMGGMENEEDNEGAPTAFNTHYNDGKSNKVGNLGDGFGQPKVQAPNKVATKPAAGHSDSSGAPQALNHSVNDGKNNKVGNLGDGFGQPKVQPMNKAVKA